MLFKKIVLQDDTWVWTLNEICAKKTKKFSSAVSWHLLVTNKQAKKVLFLGQLYWILRFTPLQYLQYVFKWISSSIYKFGLSGCLSVCLFVCLFVSNKRQIGPKFFVGHLETPGKVYDSSKFQIFVSIKIRSSLNFLKFWKSAEIFCENPRIIFILFYDVHKENMFRTNLEDGREAKRPLRLERRAWSALNF